MVSMREQLEALTVGMARQVAGWLPAVTPERYVAWGMSACHCFWRSP